MSSHVLRLPLTALLAVACTSACTFKSEEAKTATERTQYQSENAGIQFVHLETDAWPGDTERIFAKDDWAYIRSTFEASWDRAGKLLQTQFERLQGPASSGIKLESVELFTRNTIKVENFELGFDARGTGDQPIHKGARLIFSGGASEVLANAKFNFGEGKPFEIVSMDVPFRYAKLKPGFEFNVDVGDVFASLISVPGAGKAAEFLGGLLGVTSFKAAGKLQGIARFVLGEERRFDGPHGKYSAFEHHLATQIFAKLCRTIESRKGTSQAETDKACAPIVTPKGELVDEVADAYNTMKIAKCEPRMKNNQPVVENANYLYDIYFVAPSTGKFNIDLVQSGRELRVFQEQAGEFKKVGAYGTVENPAQVDKCGPLQNESRCIQLRFGRSTLSNKRIDAEKSCAAMAGTHVVSFRKDDFKKAVPPAGQ